MTIVSRRHPSTSEISWRQRQDMERLTRVIVRHTKNRCWYVVTGTGIDGVRLQRMFKGAPDGPVTLKTWAQFYRIYQLPPDYPAAGSKSSARE